MSAGEHHDCASFEVSADRIEAYDDQCRVVIGCHRVRRADQNEGRLAASLERKKRSEVGVMGDNDPRIGGSAIENLVVRGINESISRTATASYPFDLNNSATRGDMLASTRNLTLGE